VEGTGYTLLYYMPTHSLTLFLVAISVSCFQFTYTSPGAVAFILEVDSMHSVWLIGCNRSAQAIKLILNTVTLVPLGNLHKLTWHHSAPCLIGCKGFIATRV